MYELNPQNVNSMLILSSEGTKEDESTNLSPYNTTYGSLINIDKTKKSIVKYLATTRNTNLNYEYILKDDVTICFILGIDNDEQVLPFWDHPMYLRDINNKKIVVTDLRKYTRKSAEQPMSIKEVVKDPSSVNFLIIRTIIMADYIAGDLSKFRAYNKAIVSSFSYVLSGAINSMIMLDPVEKVYVEIVLAHYVNLLLTDVSERDYIMGNIIARISTLKLSVPVNSKSIENTIIKLNHDVTNIEGLIKNIKLVLPVEKSDSINTSALVSIISNIWYGPGGTETVVMGLEHMPTWMALAYTSVADKGFKRTRLATTLDKYSKKIDSVTFEKEFGLYIKERTFL